ncbi:MAG: tetratricopeptide repeat protein [Candidatus Neomarinimicrobiota bacterium]|nr:tetratricopeptide repeat protein [Candidatus Neomarinimicrobiota bacterium]|tara:strand:+ start:2943 stop:5303 length:2361 start_codon:yes stop_codon:yes gene_type:complete
MLKILLISFLISLIFGNKSDKQENINILINKFYNEVKLENYDNAKKLASRALAELELDTEVNKETFAEYLEIFANFYLNIEEDSIAKILYFRSAKIYENEITRFQSKLLNPINGLKKLTYTTTDTNLRNSYSKIFEELNDSSRINYQNTNKLNPYINWFPEIRYNHIHDDTTLKIIHTNNEAFELTNIALSYFEKGLYEDALELFSQVLSLENNHLDHQYLTKNLFKKQDSTKLFLDEILKLDSLSQLSNNERMILGIAQLNQTNFADAYSNILKFEEYYPKELRTHLLLGDLFYGLEDWFEALINYHWAIQLSPENIHAKVQIALCLMHRKDYEGARIVIENMTLDNLSDYRIYHALGKIYFIEKKYTLAETQLKKAISLEKTNASLYFDLGKTYLNTGKLSLALEAFNKSILFEKENGEYHFYLGQIYEKILQIDDAIINYKITRKFSPEIDEANRRLGILLYEKEKYRAAVEPLRDYIIQNPDSTRVLNIFSNVLLNESRFPEAIDGFSRLIEKDPTLIDNYLKLAFAYKEMNEFENAIAVYKEALSFNDELTEVYNQLGYATFELGYYDETIRYLLESINCKTPNYDTNYLLGLTYGNLGKPLQAILAFNQAYLLNQSDISIFFQKGVLLMKLNLFEDAHSNFESYLENNPNDALANFFTGKCLYELRMYDEAIEYFYTVLNYDNSDSDSQYFIGLCLKELGLLEESAVALKKATLMNPDKDVYHFSIGKLYLEIGKSRLAYNEANILKLLGSSYYDTLNILIKNTLSISDTINIDIFNKTN